MKPNRFSLVLLIFVLVGCTTPPAPVTPLPTLVPKTLPPTWTLAPSAPISISATFTPTPTSTATSTFTPDPEILLSYFTPTLAEGSLAITATEPEPSSTPVGRPLTGGDQWLISLPGIKFTYLGSTKNGDFLVLGVVDNLDARERTDILLRINPDGQIQWQKHISPATLHGVLEVDDGGFIVMDGWSLTKLNSNGEFSWHEKLEYTDQSQVYSYFPVMQSSQEGDNGQSIVLSYSTTKSILAPDGGLLGQHNLGLLQQEGYSAFWLTRDTHWQAGKSEFTGFWIVRGEEDQAAWLRTFNFQNLGIDVVSDNQKIIGTSDGGAIFGATVPYLRSIARVASIWLARVNQNGDILWQTAIDGVEEDDLLLHETRDGGYLISSSSGYMSEWPFTHLRLIRLTSNGDLIWDRWYGDGINHLKPVGVVEGLDGGFLLAAQSSPTGDLYEEQDLLLLKTDRNGEVRNCSWMQITPFDPPEVKAPDTTLSGWTDAVPYLADITMTRVSEPWLEFQNADQGLNIICKYP